MKKSFLTGLIILLPLALTVAIVIFIVNFFTRPFVDIVSNIFQHMGLFEKGFLFLSAAQVQKIFSQLFILFLLFFMTVGLGVLARWFFVNSLIKTGDYIFHRIPFVRSIYKTSQDVIKTIFATETRSFKQVVLVPFPNLQTKTIGLVTRENFQGAGRDLVAVFVPTTPNPTSGFLMMYNPEDLVYLEMAVEDAFKYIISCGVILTPFKTVPYKPSEGTESLP